MNRGNRVVDMLFYEGEDSKLEKLFERGYKLSSSQLYSRYFKKHLPPKLSSFEIITNNIHQTEKLDRLKFMN